VIARLDPPGSLPARIDCDTDIASGVEGHVMGAERAQGLLERRGASSCGCTRKGRGNLDFMPDDKGSSIKLTRQVNMRTHLESPRRKLLRLLLARRFRANTRGATAVEFAIVAPILFLMLLGILEISFFFLAGDILETANVTATRKLMTAQLPTLAATDVCSELLVPNMFKCTNLQIKISSAKCFSTLASSAGATGAGSPGDAVMVEASYPWSGFGGFALALAGYRSLTLRSVSVFRNPPTDSSASTPTC